MSFGTSSNIYRLFVYISDLWNYIIIEKKKRKNVTIEEDRKSPCRDGNISVPSDLQEVFTPLNACNFSERLVFHQEILF